MTRPAHLSESDEVCPVCHGTRALTQTIVGFGGMPEEIVALGTGCEFCTVDGARDAYVRGDIEADELERRIEKAQEMDAPLYNEGRLNGR